MSHTYLQRLVLASALALGVTVAHAATESQSDLVAALSKSKLTLADGIRQAAKSGEVAISAKFEFDDGGKLSLSVYTAEKGLSVDPEKNVLKELSGSPEQSQWKPEVEVFKDVPHVARSAEQLTLLSLTPPYPARCAHEGPKDVSRRESLLHHTGDQTTQACGGRAGQQ